MAEQKTPTAAKRPAGAPAKKASKSGARKPSRAAAEAPSEATTTKPARASASKASGGAAKKGSASTAKKGSASTAKKPARPSRAARAKAVKEAARSYFDAIAARDASALSRQWHSAGVNDIVPLGIFRGPPAVHQIFGELFAAVPDITFTVERITADDRAAAVQWRASGSFDGAPFQGIQPTGRRVELRGTDCLEIDEEGMIVRGTAYYDGAAFARAIGMLPPEDSGAERAMITGFNAVTKLRKAVARAR